MRLVATALTVVIVACVPAVLLGNALWVLVNPWLVDVQYALPGFPDDRLGFTDAQRADLASVGVRSIRPQDGEGVALLREASLPAGGAAFDEREIRHMGDVRSVVRGFLVAWALALGALAAAALALGRAGEAGSVSRALVAGCLLTLGLFAALGLLMLVSFDAFFEGFHGVFFEGDSWRFGPEDTLRSLYPDAFWGVAGATAAALVLAQALALAGVLRWRAARGRA